MSYISPTPREQLSPEQKVVYDELTTITNKGFGDQFVYKRKSDGAFVGPFPLFLAVPDAGAGILQLVGKLAAIPGLSPEARETAILVTGARFKAAYELYAHENLAIKSTSLSEPQVKALSSGGKPEGLDEACEVAFDVAAHLTATPGPLPRQLWERADKVLGREGAVALVHYVGIYAHTCIVLNAIDAPVPTDGE